MCEVLSPEDLLLLNSVITWVSAGRESCGRLERWAPTGQTWKPESIGAAVPAQWPCPRSSHWRCWLSPLSCSRASRPPPHVGFQMRRRGGTVVMQAEAEAVCDRSSRDKALSLGGGLKESQRQPLPEGHRLETSGRDAPAPDLRIFW